MDALDRRKLIGALLCGAAGAAGLALIPGAAEAMPFNSRVALNPDDLIEKAQVVVVGPHRRPRRRRWVCWWHRGRRVCGWRW